MASSVKKIKQAILAHGYEDYLKHLSEIGLARAAKGFRVSRRKYLRGLRAARAQALRGLPPQPLDTSWFQWTVSEDFPSDIHLQRNTDGSVTVVAGKAPTNELPAPLHPVPKDDSHRLFDYDAGFAPVGWAEMAFGLHRDAW